MTFQIGTGSGSWAWNQAWYMRTSLAWEVDRGACCLIKFQQALLIRIWPSGCSSGTSSRTMGASVNSGTVQLDALQRAVC